MPKLKIVSLILNTINYSPEFREGLLRSDMFHVNNNNNAIMIIILLIR